MSRGLGLTREELRNVAGLSGIFMLRMLGLFLVLPVLSVYALTLGGATPLLAGLAVGAYGLAQTVMQVPVGMLSDRLGRKPVIAGGLAVYAAGSVVAAVSGGIWGLLLGRLIQGAGAIASVVVAFIADLTRDEVRGRAMAFVGIAIGVSFASGFVLGPLLSARWGVPFLFWLMAGLDVLAIAYLVFVVPAGPPKRAASISLGEVGRILRHRDLAALDAVMFVLHMALTAVWVVTPPLLLARWERGELWRVYLPMILLAGFTMLPAVFWAESRGRLRALLGAGLAVSAAGFLMLALSAGRPGLTAGGLIVFFVGFNLMEPVLPSLVTRFAPEELRGTAVGVFNMAQFMGAFCGGALGGVFLGHGRHGLYWALLALCLPWAWAASRLSAPPRRDGKRDVETVAETA